MAITVNEFDAEKASENARRRKDYYVAYYQKSRDRMKEVTILTLRIRHDDREMMGFYSWLMEHYPSKRKNGTVDMDAFVRSNKKRIMEEN